MDAFGLELELDRLEARIAQQAGEAALGCWRGGVLAPPPILLVEATRRALAAARVLPGEPGERATRLWRMTIDALATAADPARTTPAAARTEAGLIAARDARNAAARRLGFADAWALARTVAGEDDQPVPLESGDPDAAADEPADDAGFERVLADPRPLIDAVARDHDVTPAALTVEIIAGDAPDAGRTYVIAPGQDVRVRVWRRPGAAARGTVRVLLHELGHALLAASWRDRPWALCAPPSRAFDEATAAWTAGLLERDDFLAAHGLPAVAAAERAARARRRARLVGAAEVERAFLTAGGAAPWQDALAWTEPGASYSYAAAEALRDVFDALPGAPPRW